MMLRTVRRTPLGLEKLYTRAILTYLLVIGMNNAFLFKKFYWVFWAFVMAGEGIGSFYAQQRKQLSGVDMEDVANLPVSPEVIGAMAE